MTRRFHLQRSEDVSGMSGIGRVAEGVEWSDGTVAVRWLGHWPSTVVHHDEGVASVVHLHSHQGRTVVVWDDPPPALADQQEGTVAGWPES